MKLSGACFEPCVMYRYHTFVTFQILRECYTTSQSANHEFPETLFPSSRRFLEAWSKLPFSLFETMDAGWLIFRPLFAAFRVLLYYGFRVETACIHVLISPPQVI